MVAQFRSLSFFAVVLAVGVGWISVPPRANAEDGKTALPEYRTWIGDFDGMQKRRQIRIIVPYSKTIFFIDKGEQLGTAAEWGDEFDKWLNEGIKAELQRIRIAFVPTPREQLLTAPERRSRRYCCRQPDNHAGSPAKSGFHNSGLEKRSRNIGERPVSARNWKA
jgi:hypothetical protein